MILKAAKLSLLFVSCLLMRLIPVRVPNVEPILAVLMPLGGMYGVPAAIFFAFSSIVAYDALTGTLGAHTLFTLFAYGSIAFAAARYFRKKELTVSNYVRFAIAGTLFFDAATGLTVGPLFFDQPLSAAFAGQIPFTALHLLGNVAFAATLSPAIHYLLKRKRKRDKHGSLIINPLNPKTI